MRIVRGADTPYQPASHEDPQAPGVLKKVLGQRADFLRGHVQMVNWSWLKTGHSFQRHFHEDMQEIFVLISGRVAATVDGQGVELAAGDALFVEPREIHEMRNIGDVDVYYVVFGISAERGGRTVIVDDHP